LAKIKIIIIPILAFVIIVIYLLTIYPKWLFPSVSFTIYSITIILGACVFLIGTGISLSNFIMRDSIIKMKEHIVVRAIMERRYFDLWFIFPVTMIFEELLFRLFLFELLYSYFDLITTIYIGTIIFSLFHLHTLSFKDINITLAFVILSIFLGVVLNFFFYFFGLIFCIFIHWLCVFIIFLNIENKIK